MTTWTDPKVEKFRSDLVAVIQLHQGAIEAPTLFSAAMDIVNRLAIPGCPMPEATTLPPPTDPPAETGIGLLRPAA